jgi:hypothetical protein
MKSKLAALRSNELLDFVRRYYSAQPEPSPLILSSNIPSAAWRVIQPKHQRSMHERAQSIQEDSAFKHHLLPLMTCEGSDMPLSLTIQQESNAELTRWEESYQAFKSCG